MVRTTRAICATGIAPPGGADRQILDMVGRGALGGNGARDDVDAFVVHAQARHRRAADQCLQRLGDALRGEAEGAGARLVDFETQRRHALAPVEMGIDDARDRSALASRTCAGDLQRLVGVRANDAELHGEADRRAEIETVDAYSRLA